jgi:hypothetical protein
MNGSVKCLALVPGGEQNLSRAKMLVACISW